MMSDSSTEVGQENRPVALVVDDEIHIRLMLERCLTRIRFEVRSISRGDEAVRLVERGGIDVVILDFQIPGGDGLETLKALRALPAGEKLPVIMLTAQGRGDVEVQAAALGVASFFGKPFSPSDLARTALRLV